MLLIRCCGFIIRVEHPLHRDCNSSKTLLVLLHTPRPVQVSDASSCNSVLALHVNCLRKSVTRMLRQSWRFPNSISPISSCQSYLPQKRRLPSASRARLRWRRRRKREISSCWTVSHQHDLNDTKLSQDPKRRSSGSKEYRTGYQERTLTYRISRGQQLICCSRGSTVIS